jgi:hypothetical protein
LLRKSSERVSMREVIAGMVVLSAVEGCSGWELNGSAATGRREAAAPLDAACASGYRSAT